LFVNILIFSIFLSFLYFVPSPEPIFGRRPGANFPERTRPPAEAPGLIAARRGTVLPAPAAMRSWHPSDSQCLASRR